MIVLPLMLLHQIQLMVCAVLAKRYANTWLGRGAAGPRQSSRTGGAAEVA